MNIIKMLFLMDLIMIIMRGYCFADTIQCSPKQDVNGTVSDGRHDSLVKSLNKLWNESKVSSR